MSIMTWLTAFCSGFALGGTGASLYILHGLGKR
jgi:hypothetical protein